MPGYLEEYGVEEARRETTLKRFAVAGVILLVVAAAAALFLWASPIVGTKLAARQQTVAFFDELRQRDYESAYRLWGCTAETPCPDYTFDKFLEDWGPAGLYGKASALQVERSTSCGTGVILNVAGGVALWYERSDSTLGFAPLTVCYPPRTLPVRLVDGLVDLF